MTDYKKVLTDVLTESLAFFAEHRTAIAEQGDDTEYYLRGLIGTNADSILDGDANKINALGNSPSSALRTIEHNLARVFYEQQKGMNQHSITHVAATAQAEKTRIMEALALAVNHGVSPKSAVWEIYSKSFGISAQQVAVIDGSMEFDL